MTADHITPHREWPKDDLGRPLPGLDSPENLRAAHGSRGSAEHNPCYQCDPRGRHCNQSRGAGNRVNRQPPTQQRENHSRTW